VLVGVGRWVDKNREAIFETGLNPFLKLDWGQVSTSSGVLYLHIHNLPADNKLILLGLVNNVEQVIAQSVAGAPLSIKLLNGDTIIDLSSMKKDPYLIILKLSYKDELKTIPHHSSANQNGKIILVGDKATKEGKFGKESYRSMLKDFLRSCYPDVPKAGNYQVSMSYKMRYKDKDFILVSANDEVVFNLQGRGQKVEAIQAFDGNEQKLNITETVKKDSNTAENLVQRSVVY